MPKSATREGIANRLRRWADSAVVEGRFFVALAIIGGLVGDFVGVLVDPHFPAISGIELALAIGTLALAYSAALQAVVALQKRRDDLLPHLDLQVLEKPGLPFGLAQPTGGDRFLLESDRWTIRLRARNLGPGNAMNVRLTTGEWWQQTNLTDDELSHQAAGKTIELTPIYNSPDRSRPVVNAPFSLRANEEYPFEIQFRVPPRLPDPGSPHKSYIFLLQAVVSLAGEGVEGIRASEVRLGVLLQRASQVHPPPFPGLDRDLEVRTLWRRLTDDEVSRVSFAAPL